MVNFNCVFIQHNNQHQSNKLLRKSQYFDTGFKNFEALYEIGKI